VNRNSVRLIGLLLLIPSAFLGLMPYLASHTSMLAGMPEFTWIIGERVIAEYQKDLNGVALATTWWGVWVVAVVAELLVLGAYVYRPIQRNTHKITING
jgi:hypothetical protein